MLGAYNVNGAPCELLVEQEALTWWPRAPTPATGGGTATQNGPLKHLRRLSDASSVIFGVGGGDGLSQQPAPGEPASRAGNNNEEKRDISKTPTANHDGSRHAKQRRIEFSQIVGLKRVPAGNMKTKQAPHSKRPKAAAAAAVPADTQSDKSPTSNNATISDESAADAAETEQAAAAAAAAGSLGRFKLYYVKRNENKATGRLMKLKKISIEAPPPPSSSRHKSEDWPSESQDSSSASDGAQTSRGGGDESDNNKHTSSAALEGLYEQIEQYLELVRRARPKRLLVFVNPYGGKGRALQLYRTRVRKVLELAQVECELVVTKYANHARETLEDPAYELARFDGIVCVGGDGMFAELMNGLLFRCNRDKLLAATGGDKSTSGDSLSSCAVTGGGESRSSSSSLTTSNENTTTTNHDTKSNSLGTPSTGNSSSSSSCDSQPSLEATPHEDSSHAAPYRTLPVVRNNTVEQQLEFLRSALGGIGEQFAAPCLPIGMIGAGSTDANLFGFLGTNDATSATLSIILGQQLTIDVCSLHSLRDDRLLRFVSTFVAYGYFGDVIRESEKFRWMGPTRYDVTAVNSLIKYRHYPGRVRILRSKRDGTPLNFADRCHLNCQLCCGQQSSGGGDSNNNSNNNNGEHMPKAPLTSSSFGFDEAAAQLANLSLGDSAAAAAACHESRHAHATGANTPTAASEFEILEEAGPFVGVNAAVTACRCPQTRKGFSPANHLANGCADLILVRPCTRLQYINYLVRTGYTKKSAFDLKYVDAFRCRQFEFIAEDEPRVVGADTCGLNGAHQAREAREQPPRGKSSSSSWNADGEILRESSLRVKVNQRLLRVFGTGEPQRAHKQHRKHKQQQQQQQQQQQELMGR